MAEVVWTTRATADLEAIADYLAQSAPAYAEVVIRRLLASVDRLESFPLSGRVVPEIGQEDMREGVSFLTATWRLIRRGVTAA